MSEVKSDGVGEAGAEGRKVSRGQVAMILVAVVFLIVGVVLRATADPVPAEGMSGVAGGSSLVGGGGLPGFGGDGTGGAAAEDDSLSGYAPFFLKGGFSFLIAFCVGLALRIFLKGTALVLGVVALAVFGLQYLGWVEVDWAKMSDWWDSISGRMMAKSEGFKGFMTGNLPSAGLASLGLFTGFRRG